MANITITLPQRTGEDARIIMVYYNYVMDELRRVTGESHCQIKHSNNMITEVGDLLYIPNKPLSTKDIENKIALGPLTIVFKPYTVYDKKDMK